ncbi:MAG: hypothetical protein Q8M29_15325 [Bacteroidota bacterium]|nr:hypothetical protein [Bacteroidota bacterium]
MKKLRINIVGIALLGLLFLSSCEDYVNLNEHEKQMAEMQELEEYKQDSIESLYIATLDEIDKNLDAIRDREGVLMLVPASNADVGVDKKEQIINNISMINTLLEENKEKLKKLESSLAYYKKGKKELLSSIEQSKARIQAQENDIQNLKNLLQENNYKISELNKQLDDKTQLAEVLNDKSNKLNKDLNRVYFASGTYKELKQNKIVEKTGGILGLGRVKKLSKEVDRAKFVELDKTESTVLMVNGKHPKLITNHPVDSYTVTESENDMAQLVIKDPENFWSNSKYLVIEVK